MVTKMYIFYLPSKHMHLYLNRFIFSTYEVIYTYISMLFFFKALLVASFL